MIDFEGISSRQLIAELERRGLQLSDLGLQVIQAEEPIVGIVGKTWRVWWKSPSGFKSTIPISEADGPETLAKLVAESSFEHWLLKEGEFPPGYIDDSPTAKLAFLKTKGLTVGVAKDADKDPYLAFVIEPGSALCDRETLSKLVDAEIAAKRAEEILQACYEQLPEEMKRRACLDAEHNVTDKPILSNLPEVIKFLGNLAYIWIPGTLSAKGAQAVLDEVTTRLAKAGFGFVADGTVYGNGIFVHRLGVRETHEPTPEVQAAGALTRLLPTQQENPDGLHGRYWIRKADGRLCDPDAVYFVLRLDNGGSDQAHIKAGRFAARMYSLFLQTIKATHLQQLAEELVALCNTIDYDEQVDFPGFNVVEIRDMFVNPVAFDLAYDYNAAKEVEADAFGAKDSADWHKRRGEFLKSRAAELEAKF